LVQQKIAEEVRTKISDEHTLPVDAYNPDKLDIVEK